MWWCVLDPVVGTEIAKTRPVLIVSVDRMNEGSFRRSIGVPLTSTQRRGSVAIELPTTDGSKISYAEAFQVRALSHDRLTTRIGVANADALRAVVKRLAILTAVP